MPGQPNPTFEVDVDEQGLPPAPVGGGNVPLIIGWTQSGQFSGYPGVGLYSSANLQALTSQLGNYGNAVDAAALDFSAGASEVLVYKAFFGAVGNGNWTRTGTGTGTIAVSANAPLAPYGVATATGSTGIEILITTASNGSLFGQFAFSLDGGITFSTPQNIVTGSPILLGNSGVSVTFTGADSVGVWVAGDTYLKAITTAVGLMYPYGGSTFTAGLKQTTATGSTSVLGEGTFADNSSNPVDNFQVVIQITATGTSAAGTAQYVASLDGGITFGPNQLMPASSAAITLPGGISLTPADTGGPGGSQAGFVAGELYRFSTQGPQLSPAQFLAILNSLQGNPATWGWIHITQQCNTVNTAATNGCELDTLFTDLEAGLGNLWDSGKYTGAYVLYDSPPDTTTNNIDSLLESWAAGVAGQYSSIGTGSAAATVSPANGWQLPRGSSWDLSARLCSAPLGQDPAWVGKGPLFGVGTQNLYRNEALTPGLGPAGFVTLQTQPNKGGVYITNGNLLVASNNSIALSQYRRLINAGAAAAQSALIDYLSAGLRLTPSGNIDPRDIAAMEQVGGSAVRTVVRGQVSSAQCVVSPIFNTDDELDIDVIMQPLGYPKKIKVRIGFSNPALSAAAAA